MNKFSKKLGVVLALLAAAGSSQAALDPAIATAVQSGVVDILAIVAIGGMAFVTISGSGVVWNVASKFIKRLGGKA